ncbi:TraB/GumN family protein [Thermomonas carbonis]|uniref:TraB/GumN family protein n=1 Tax=Thermomonas carbonis TaxID=1463158 RepID=A0A7G9SPV2_9GAMM|nr:TraB/GumN family protein [Thermomonas carbonis]QNN69877.1 TraB/GumN family protein [Thermomonas carbonis]GHB96050.1 hypothetical protein GCM10010080_04780 [Thermomonas carbonis]
MTGMARQRDAFLPAHAPARWLLATLLMPALAHGQSGASALPQPDAPAAATRGVSANAAREAASAQLEQVRPVANAPLDPSLPGQPQAPPVMAADAVPAKPVDVDAAAADSAATAASPPQRGVIFRITPPAVALLPAEAGQSTTPGPGQSASSATPATSVPPPRPSYLLGTIHFGTPEEQGIDYAKLEQLLGETETFVNEANLDEAWKSEYDGYRWLPVETPLEAMIGKEAITLANALLPQVRPQDLQRMKPWSVLALLEARGESGGEATMDARLQRMASGAGKRLAHLETLEQQLQALDCVPAQEHSMVLAERLRTSWILRIESAEAMAFYRSRNLDAWLASIDRMEGLGEQAKAIEQRSRYCLLEERNARWIGPLETLFQDGPSLVAVGAVHLVGNDGLLAALRRDGYTVEALPW